MSVGLIVTDPPWDLYGGGIFDACASYDRLSVEAISLLLADARRVLVPGGHLYVFATAGRYQVSLFQCERLRIESGNRLFP